MYNNTMVVPDSDCKKIVEHIQNFIQGNETNDVSLEYVWGCIDVVFYDDVISIYFDFHNGSGKVYMIGTTFTKSVVLEDKEDSLSIYEDKGDNIYFCKL